MKMNIELEINIYMKKVSNLGLYDFYLVSYFPIFLAILFELFILLMGIDAYIEEKILFQYFSIHWLIRLIVYIIVAYNISYRLNGNGFDGMFLAHTAFTLGGILK